MAIDSPVAWRRTLGRWADGTGPRDRLAGLLARTSRWAIHTTGSGGGSTLPGRLAEYVAPGVLGRTVGNRRQGWALYAAMMAMFVVAVAVVYVAEQHGSPAQHHAGVLTSAFDGSTGGNMEGKEQRFGIAESSLWTAVTTVTSCGAVNASLDSLTGIGGLVPLANMGTGEVDLNWAKEHHSLWVEEAQAKAAAASDTPRAVPAE